MIVLITLVIPVGGSAGPFNLYSNIDGYTVPFATNISAAVLQAGYTSNVVPDGTVTIRVISADICTNFIDIPVNVLTTTTTSSSSTTTTTTTVLDACVTYTLQALVNNASWIANTCEDVSTGGIIPLAGGIITTPCIINNTLVLTQAVIVTETECTTTTTTTAAPTTTTTSTTIAPTTTTTSSTTEFIGCASYGLEAKTEDSILFFYNACFGRSDIPIIVPGNTTVTVCANGSPTTTAPSYKGEVSFEGPC